MTNRTAPLPHEFEISIFGRGYGESILIHYGDGQWVLIDSLQEEDKQVSPLNYLCEIGVNVKTDIRLIVVTHWHDDHIVGISTVYEQANGALLSMPIAMNSKELEAFNGRARRGGTEHIKSGVAELDQIAIIQNRDKRCPIRLAKANQILLRCLDTEMTHGNHICMEALSPSDADTQTFLKRISYVPNLQGGQRVEPFEHNDVAIALWISVGNHRILLGSDLETTNDPLRGWDAVFNPHISLDGLATVIKIPHHGSHNGHHERIWNTLLTKSPIATLTTWNRGSKLPSRSDIARILGLTKDAYITSRLDKKPSNRLRTVERKLNEVGARVRSLPKRAGHIRLRLDLNTETPQWQISLFNGALPLSELAS